MKRGNYLNKKSQITILIVIALVLIIAIILVFTIRTKIADKDKSFPEISEINNKFQTCFNQRSLDAVYLIGLQGGYVKLPKDNLKIGLSSTAYGLKDNKNTLPSLSTIEKEISSFLELTLSFCVNEEDFPELDLNYEVKKVNTKILDNQIQTETLISFSATKDDKSFTLNQNYNSEIPIRLKLIHETANEIIKKHLENTEFVPLSFLTEQEFDITFSHYDDATLIYVITDFDYLISESDELNELDEIPYSFMFGVGR